MDWANQDNVKWRIVFRKQNEGSQGGWVILNKNSGSPLCLNNMFSKSNGGVFIIKSPVYADGAYEPEQTFSFERITEQQPKLREEKLYEKSPVCSNKSEAIGGLLPVRDIPRFKPFFILFSIFTGIIDADLCARWGCLRWRNIPCFCFPCRACMPHWNARHGYKAIRNQVPVPAFFLLYWNWKNNQLRQMRWQYCNRMPAAINGAISKFHLLQYAACKKPRPLPFTFLCTAVCSYAFRVKIYRRRVVGLPL